MTSEFMLDTDTVSWALRGQGAVPAHVLKYRPSQLCISSITLSELRFGADAKASRKLHGLIDTFVLSVAVMPFDQAAADRFGPVASALAKRGEPIGTFDTLIAAVPALRAAIPDVRVIVAGREGSHTDELKRLIRTHSVDDVVTLLGHRDDVAELLAAADVLAFPSRREGLPGTLIEALALECPVVATDLPNVHEVMGDCAAALVTVDDARKLADALIRALREPARLRVLATHGRTRFLDMFTIEQSAAGMLAFYERSR